MPSLEISKYYDATEGREIRPDLVHALTLAPHPKVAVDCGCGAGADIDYLLREGFVVHGYDNEEEAISRCESRFPTRPDLTLKVDDFCSFDYPSASLVVADASLFFCAKRDFSLAWRKIRECLVPGGVFCGSFLGPEDTMAGPDYDRAAYWPEICVFDRQEVRSIFDGFTIHRFTEHKTSGKTPDGKKHNWHIFAAIAQKLHT